MKPIIGITVYRTTFLIVLFATTIINYSQKTIELAGKKYSIKGTLLCSYKDDHSYSEPMDVECYVDLTNDSLFFYEIGWIKKETYYLDINKAALRDLSPEETPYIFASEFRQEGKLFYELHVFTKDFAELVINLYHTKYNVKKNLFGVLKICFKTEEEAKKYNEDLKKLIK